MTTTDTAPYPILEIQPDWVLESEAMGSKDKFWYRDGDGPDWLFKFPQANTGQHWSEKIAAEVADGLDILHAQVELAVFQGVRGSATASFARDGREVYYGNQVLAGHVLGYDPGKQFRQSDRWTTSFSRWSGFSWRRRPLGGPRNVWPTIWCWTP
jgi:hypothetical protein